MRTLVTSYVNPDLDGYACMYAYAELLQAEARVAGKPHPEAAWVAKQLNAPLNALRSVSGYSAFILVDTAEPTAIDLDIPRQHVTEVIDHRQLHNAAAFRNAKIDIQLVGAAATLIAERMQRARHTPSRQAAGLLHAAIVSNTLNFQGNVTTQRDKDAAAWLQQYSKLTKKFLRDMFLAKSDLKGRKLRATMEGDAAVFVHNGKTIAYAQLEVIGAEGLVRSRLGEIESILGRMKEKEGAVYTFLSIIDLEKAQNIFVTIDSKILLETVLGLRFKGAVARRKGLLMRKEVRPMLKEYFSRAA